MDVELNRLAKEGGKDVSRRGPPESAEELSLRVLLVER